MLYMFWMTQSLFNLFLFLLKLVVIVTKYIVFVNS